jgi:hypothetical protein
MVSVDFQLSVLELVAELLRTAPSFLVIIDQQFPAYEAAISRERGGEMHCEFSWLVVVMMGLTGGGGGGGG